MVADDRPVKNQAFYLVRALSGFSVDPARESGDKLTRFGPFSSQCRAGNVKIRRGAWNEELFRVLEGFPDLAHEDEVDACSFGNAQYRQCRAGPPMKSRAKTPRRSVPRRKYKPQPAPSRLGGRVARLIRPYKRKLRRSRYRADTRP